MVVSKETSIYIGEIMMTMPKELIMRARRLARWVADAPDHQVNGWLVTVIVHIFAYGFSVGLVFGIVLCGLTTWSMK